MQDGMFPVERDRAISDAAVHGCWTITSCSSRGRSVSTAGVHH